MSRNTDYLPENEVELRRDEVVRRMANTPPQPKISHPQKRKKKAAGGRAARKGRAGREA